VLEHLGDVYEKLGEPQKALGAYQKALEKKAENAAALESKIEDLRQGGF
jgi:predicted negative regulator of RcsB-dependent stress response